MMSCNQKLRVFFGLVERERVRERANLQNHIGSMVIFPNLSKNKIKYSIVIFFTKKWIVNYQITI